MAYLSRNGGIGAEASARPLVSASRSSPPAAWKFAQPGSLKRLRPMTGPADASVMEEAVARQATSAGLSGIASMTAMPRLAQML